MVLPALCGLSNAVSASVCGNFCLKWKSFHRLFLRLILLSSLPSLIPKRNIDCGNYKNFNSTNMQRMKENVTE